MFGIIRVKLVFSVMFAEALIFVLQLEFSSVIFQLLIIPTPSFSYICIVCVCVCTYCVCARVYVFYQINVCLCVTKCFCVCVYVIKCLLCAYVCNQVFVCVRVCV